MKNVQNYEALNGGKEVIESKVLPKLCDMINSEIASGLNVGDLVQWVNHLYLSVRFRQNPAAYDPTCRNSCCAIWHPSGTARGPLSTNIRRVKKLDIYKLPECVHYPSRPVSHLFPVRYVQSHLTWSAPAMIHQTHLGQLAY